MKRGRRGNGEGSIYEFIQKQKRNNSNLEMCATCKECTNREICLNREKCSTLCDKCKQCTDCLNYCDRYYIYERCASQASKKDGGRTSPKYAKKKKDATKDNLDTLNKVNNNTIVDISKVTLYEIAESIVEDRHNKNKTTDNSYIANLAKLNRLKKHPFMHKPAQKVTDQDLHDYLNYMVIYSDSVIGKDYGLLNATFIKAVRKKVISLNPLDDKDEFSKPRAKQKAKKVRAFNLTEHKKFASAIKKEDKNKYKHGWLLMLGLGLRPGEAYALDKDKDVDFSSKKIHIQNSLTHDKNGKIILGDRTKTYAGDRFIDMDRDAEAIIKEAFLVSPENEYNLLFWDTKRNDFFSVSASNSAFKRFCKKNRVGNFDNETQYVLRHSCATRKIEAGVPVEVLKDFLGHKDIDVTLNTYFDAFAEYKNKYNKLSENYMMEQELNYLDLSLKDKSLIEIDRISKILDSSPLDDLDKKILYSALSKLKLKYNSLVEQIC